MAATGEVPGDVSALTAAERGRAAAFHDPSDAADFVAAHLLARTAVTRLTGVVDVVLEQRCATCGGQHGKPSVAGHPEVEVSWSHTRGHVAAVADHAPVGIDLETRARGHDVGRLLRRTATGPEAAEIAASDDPQTAYLRMWVAKEALVKVGAITLADFARTDVRAGDYAGFGLSVTDSATTVLGVAVTRR